MVNGGKQPLVVTGEAELRQELERSCAGAGLAPVIAERAEDARPAWGSACCVLVGGDLASELTAHRMQWRDGLVLVSTEPVNSETWQQALAIRAEHVCALPDERSWLASYLVEAADQDGRPGQVVGVFAGRGGAGASTLSFALAREAASAGLRPILIDGDPLAGGLEPIVGCEDTPGLRWADVSGAGGRVSASALRAALPVCGGTAVLATTTPGSPTLGQLDDVVGAVRRGADLVVVDLPRRLDRSMLEFVGSNIDCTIVVTTSDVRAAASARRFVEVLASHCTDVRVAVRSGAFDLLPAEDLASSLGAPLAVTFATRRAVQRAVDEGLGPSLRFRERRRLRRLVDELTIAHRMKPTALC